MEFKKVASLKFGEVFYSQENSMYYVYTRARGYGDLVFQFGVPVENTPDIEDLVWKNLKSSNLYFEID